MSDSDGDNVAASPLPDTQELALRIAGAAKALAETFTPLPAGQQRVMSQVLDDLTVARDDIQQWDHENLIRPHIMGLTRGHLPFEAMMAHEKLTYLHALVHVLEMMNLPIVTIETILDVAQDQEPRLLLAIEAMLARLEEPPAQREPLVMDEMAFEGLAGEFVNLVKPYTEASPVAMLVQLLTCVGNVVGIRPKLIRGGVRHPPRLFVMVLGESSRARKGTSWDHVLQFMEMVDPVWTKLIRSGLSTGEGVIKHLNDRTGDDEDGMPVEQSDRRLLLAETEMTKALTVMKRQNNPLSEILRQAFDASGNLAVLTRGDPLVASSTHISIFGHTTSDEYVKDLPPDELKTGFVNRFMHFLIDRQGLYDEDDFADLHVMRGLAEQLSRMVVKASHRDVYRFSPEASDMWKGGLYRQLEEDVPPGGFGDAIARNSTHVQRLALIFAIIDGAEDVEPRHLLRALRVWEYARASAERIFGGRVMLTPDELVLLQKLEEVGTDGLTGTQRQALFHRKKDGTRRIRAAAEVLVSLGYAVQVKRLNEAGGRPADVLVHMKHAVTGWRVDR